MQSLINLTPKKKCSGTHQVDSSATVDIQLSKNTIREIVKEIVTGFVFELCLTVKLLSVSQNCTLFREYKKDSITEWISDSKNVFYFTRILI